DWTATIANAPAGLTGLLTVELALLRMVVGRVPTALTRVAINGVDDKDARARGLVSLEIVECSYRGDVRRALQGILSFYSSTNPMNAAPAVRSASLPRKPPVPFAVRLVVGKVTLDDVESVIRGADHRVAVAFLEHVVQYAGGLNVKQLDRLAGLFDVPEYVSFPSILIALEDLVDSDPGSVAAWLIDHLSTDELHKDVLHVDHWADLAIRVLRSTDLTHTMRGRLIQDARSRLVAVAGWIDTESEILLAVTVAPTARDDARQFVERVVSPFMVGPALCTLASHRDAGSRRWLTSFREGLAVTGAATGESMISVVELLGRAVAKAGPQRLGEVVLDGGLDTWPGGFVGAAGACAAMSKELAVATRGLVMLDAIDILRRARDSSKQMVTGRVVNS
ncbi:MAG: hypothetical protein LC808_33440, partial [Actinobacteria bacterium]|nr:hypothetical protein [Actinomycetota bacterium]